MISVAESAPRPVGAGGKAVRPEPSVMINPKELAERRVDGALGHHRDQMCTVVGFSVDIEGEAVGVDLDRRYRGWIEILRQRFLHRWHPEHTGACSVHRHANTIGELCDEYADQRITRRRCLELCVARLERHGKAYRSDDLAGFERSLEQAEEELVGRDLACTG